MKDASVKELQVRGFLEKHGILTVPGWCSTVPSAGSQNAWKVLVSARTMISHLLHA